MALIGDILFYKGDLDAGLRHQFTLLPAAVDKISEPTFNAKSDEEIVELVLKDFRVEPLTLHTDQAEAKVEEGQAETRDHFRYHLPNGPMKVPGLKASKRIPFSGDPQLWKLKPNRYTLNPPYGEVRSNTLIIGITVPAAQANEAKEHIDSTLAKIPDYLNAQRAQLDEYNARLPAEVARLIQQRRGRLGTAAELLKKLQG
ncbi:hypothetical protein DK26_14855 [Bosea sp. WAO]|uniref:hypothetical protein n=1 Tax=Bosea sp. WAO TaxID=406341 RepID=UPI0007487826|nr:hypothetical protein [Bosea sp. WAO]KUL94296.1 hypothetical protein DK26_14855 [Bosea sp. WAO]